MVAIAAAVAAKITGKRAIMEIPLRHSHQINGGRPEARGDYCAQFDKKTKKIISLSVDLFMDVGFTANDGKIYNFCIHDLRACTAGPYAIENLEWKVSLLKTNKPSAVAMRGPGEIIPLYILESVFDRAAGELDCPADQLKELNLLNGHLDSVGTISTDRTFKTFKQVKEESKFAQLQKEVAQFNSENKWRKRGLGIMPLRTRWENSFVYGSVSLVVNRLDGSVLVQQFAIEIGGGTHTRVAQTVANRLNLPLDMVSVEATNTDNAANNTETGGSFSSFSAIRVADKAAQQLLTRFEKVKKSNWLDTIRAAVAAGVSTEVN